MKLNTTQRKAVTGIAIGGTLAFFVACGSEKSNNGGDSDKDPAPVVTQPRPPTPTDPNATNPNNPTKAGSQSALFPQIENAQHKQASPSQKHTLLTQEVQRCRKQGATIGATRTQVQQNTQLQAGALEAAYRSKHNNVFSYFQCRKDLNIFWGFGTTMQTHNLISLENCVREEDITKRSTKEDRNKERMSLMLENLTLLCQMEQGKLTDKVQSALSKGFVDSWTKLER